MAYVKNVYAPVEAKVDLFYEAQWGRLSRRDWLSQTAETTHLVPSQTSCHEKVTYESALGLTRHWSQKQEFFFFKTGKYFVDRRAG